MHSTGLISNLSNKFTHGRGVIYGYLLRGLKFVFKSLLHLCKASFGDCMPESYINSW